MPEAMMVVDRLDCKSDLFTMFSSQRLKVETQHYPPRCSGLLGFIYIKAVLELHLAFNERKAKDAVHYYRQVMHLSVVCPTCNTWGTMGDRRGIDSS